MSEDWFSAENSTFGDRIEAAREAAAMSQAQLARRLGVKLSTLKSWEQDLSEPRANKLSMMAGILNVSLTWLLHGMGEGVAPPGDETALAPDVVSNLNEIRELRTQMVTLVDRLAVLEKRLRTTLKEPAA